MRKWQIASLLIVVLGTAPSLWAIPPEVPEPSSLLLLAVGAGAMGAGVWGWKRTKKR